MSTPTHDRTTDRDRLPTEDQPQRGFAMMFGIKLADADYFVLDGDHVIRSREFDVIAGGATFDEALDSFNRALVSYAVYLSQLDEPTQGETEDLNSLTSRLLQTIQALEDLESEEDQARRRRRINLKRRRGHGSGRQWHPSGLAGSSPLSVV